MALQTGFRKLFGIAAALGAASLGVLGAFSTGCSDSNAETVRSACPEGTTCDARLTLLHTSDIHSRLIKFDQVITQIDADLGLGPLNEVHDVGGVSRLSYIIGRERARSSRVLHLDSGDCFQGAPIFNFYSGEPEIRALSTMGLDAAVIGNHEFDRGALNVTLQFRNWATFSALAANYKFDDPELPESPKISTVATPFKVFNSDGLKVAVIGMANLSSLSSLYAQPNRQGILPLHTVETAQFYVDLLRPHVDVIVMLTHLGLEWDQRMVQNTTGIDVVLGGHNHVVINPPQQIRDCSSDPEHPGFVWEVDPNSTVNPDDVAASDPHGPPPNKFQRPCVPRNVIIAHSGAFSKYLGRLDLVLSNDPGRASPTGNADDYNPTDGFEVVSHQYKAFPVDDAVPEDPIMDDMLRPYRQTLDLVAQLDILAGYSPNGARRISPRGGDSPLGNLIATAMWLRLGVQTDFSMTNTTGIRADLLPGPITIEQMYNIFPFDNSIAKMQLSGIELQEVMDFVARRSRSRGCVSQIQIAGARIRINCTGCNNPLSAKACSNDEQCGEGSDGCDLSIGRCRVNACADEIYVGHGTQTCESDNDCVGPDGVVHPGSCDLAGPKRCSPPVSPTNLYELATSNYLAQGGSGFLTLQRNTTQFDTQIQQRDALIDYLRQGKPCGYKADAGTAEGLMACGTDADCGDPLFVCACTGTVEASTTGDKTACTTSGTCDPAVGRCVRKDCRDDVATFNDRVCRATPDKDGCRLQLGACSVAGEQCKILSCVDRAIGNFSDDRMEMIGR